MDRNFVGVARVALVKEQSSPDVFLAYGDTKFHVASPERMDAMGLRWDKIETVADGSLADLKRVELGAGPAVRPSEVFFTSYPNVGSKDPASHVKDDVLIAGWLLNGPTWHYDPSGNPWVEDVLYDLLLDVDFIDRMYGPDGLSTALVSAQLPGNVYPIPNGPRAIPLPFGDLPPDPQGLRYATAGAFRLPGGGAWRADGQTNSGAPVLHVELNCWHTTPRLGKWRDSNGPYQIAGRGRAPDGWVNLYHEDVVSGWYATQSSFPWVYVPWAGKITDCWWPYPPENPDGLGALSSYQTLLMCGSLWQDHQHGTPGKDPPCDWEKQWPGHGGWLEMHPPDWMHRFSVAAPLRRAYSAAVSTGSGVSAISTTFDASIPPVYAPHVSIKTPPAEIVDARYSPYPNPPETHAATLAGTTVDVDVALAPAAGPTKYFAATYIAEWNQPPPWNPPPPKTHKDGKEGSGKEGKDKERKDKEGKEAMRAEKQATSPGMTYATAQYQQELASDATLPPDGDARSFVRPQERPTVGP